MRLQSSAVRSAYNRLKENYSNKDIYHLIRKTFPKLPSRYITHAIIKASTINQEYDNIVFGGKSIFEKLSKNHLQGKQRETLKNQWKENRQFNLVSIGTGNNIEKGNLLLRFVDING